MASVVGAAGMPQGTLNTEVGIDKDMLGVARTQAIGNAADENTNMLNGRLGQGPLRAGHGNYYAGGHNAFQLMGEVHDQVKTLFEYGATPLTLMCGPIGIGASFFLAGMHLTTGEYAAAALDLAMALIPGCFGAGTRLLTPDGDKPIEDFQIGDWVLSAPEDNPTAPPEPRQVEVLFRRTAALLNLHAGGQVIRTTAPHPFYVQDRGWTAASDLKPGDLLRSHDGQWAAVDAVTDSGEVATVYNLQVADYHTYFVGSREWAFSAWAHNACGKFSKGPFGIPGTGDLHHIATHYGSWGLKFRKLFASANRGIHGIGNLVYLPGHYGSHSPAYHKTVYNALADALRTVRGAANRARALEKKLGAR
jgi:hypothetical protein